MANENVNKVVYNGNTLIDLTGDSVTPQRMLTGTQAHDKAGAVINGTLPASFWANDIGVGLTLGWSDDTLTGGSFSGDVYVI